LAVDGHFFCASYTIVIIRLKLYLYVGILSWFTDGFKREAIWRVNIVGELRAVEKDEVSREGVAKPV
jgi:hypothetical protein